MANGLTHSVTGATVGLATALLDNADSLETRSELLLAGSAVGGLFGKLPDILEPAFKNPNHRQFFHSIVFLSLLGYGAKKLYEWKPDDKAEKIARKILVCASAGYLSHLVLDATTPKRLPLIGKL